MIIDDFDRVQCEEIYNDEDQSIAQIFADHVPEKNPVEINPFEIVVEMDMFMNYVVDIRKTS